MQEWKGFFSRNKFITCWIRKRSFPHLQRGSPAKPSTPAAGRQNPPGWCSSSMDTRHAGGEGPSSSGVASPEEGTTLVSAQCSSVQMLAAVAWATSALVACLLPKKPWARNDSLSYAAETLHCLAARQLSLKPRRFLCSVPSAPFFLVAALPNSVLPVPAHPKLPASLGHAFLGTENREEHHLLAKLPGHPPNTDLKG